MTKASSWLRSLSVSGLPLGEGRHLWTVDPLGASLVESQAQWTDAVDANFSLRVLMQEAAPRPLGRDRKWANEDIKAETLWFHHPVLLAAALKKASRSSLSFTDSPSRYKFEPWLSRNEIASVILAPIGAWPKSGWKVNERGRRVSEIAVPPMLLTFGAVAGRLSASDDVNLLGLTKDRILGFIRPDREATLPVSLRPDGMSFPILAPAPLLRLARLGGGREEREEIEIIEVLLTAQKAPPGVRYALRLIDGDPEFLSALKTGLRTLAQTFRDTKGCPLTVDANLSEHAPPIFWPVGRDGDRFRVDHKAFQLDPKYIRCRIESAEYADGGGSADAEATLEVVKISWRRASPAIVFDSSDGPSPQQWEGAFSWAPNEKLRAITLRSRVALDVDRLARSLGEVYRRKGVLSGEVNDSPYAFFPIRRGWLQLPLDGLPSASFGAGLASGSFVGAIVAEGPFPKTGARIELDAAARLRIEATWAGDPLTLSGVEMRMHDLRGTVRKCLFVGLETPSADEALPSLLAGDSATSDEPLFFGSGWPFEIADGTWTMEIGPGPRGAIAWREHQQLPLTTSAPLTRARVSGLPSVSRGLFPVEIDLNDDNRAKLAFGDGPPELTFKGAASQTFKWDELQTTDAPGALTALLATLPGVELSAPDFTNGEISFKRVALRYDLPILDEFFAGKSVETIDISLTDAPETAQVPPVATALNPPRLFNVALDSIRSLDFAATQSRRCLSSDVSRGSPLSVHTLVETLVWENVALSFNPVANGLPIGQYDLAGKPFAGSEALAGLNVPITLKTDYNNSIEVPLIGFASPLIEVDGHDFDTRGYSQSAALFDTGDFRVRSAHRRSQYLGPVESFSLATLKAPLVLQLGDHRYQFHCRNLPLREYAFSLSDNPVERADGSVGALIDRDSFPYGLYEWRFYSEKDGWTDRFELSMGPFGFRPLRLLHVKVDKEDQLIEVEIVGSLRLAPDPDTEKPFASAEAHQSGNLFSITFQRKGAALQASSFTRYRREATTDDVKLKPANEVPVEFHIPDAQLHFGGDREDQLVTLRLTLGTAPRSGLSAVNILKVGLDFRLLGAQMSLEASGNRINSNETGDGGIVLELSPPQGWQARGAGLDVESIKITLPPAGAGPVSIELDGKLNISASSVNDSGADSGATHLMSWTPQSCQWLGLNLNPPDAKIAGPNLHLPFKQEGVTGDLIQGISLGATMQVAGDIALQFKPVAGEWPAYDIVGLLGHIAAEGDRGRSQLTFWSDADAKLRARLSFDLKFDRQSRVEWPLNAFDANALQLSPPVRLDWTPDPSPVLHHIKFNVQDHELPLSRLAMPVVAPGANIVLGKPWFVTVRAQHRLYQRSNDGAESDWLSWTSLDHVQIQDLSSLAESSKASLKPADADTIFAFSPRYRSKSYRGEAARTSQSQIAHAGVAARDLAAAGIPDRLIALALAAHTQRESTIVLIGAGAHMATGKAVSHAFCLPWIVSLDADADLGPLGAVRQQKSTSNQTVAIAAADLAARLPLPLPPKPIPIGVGQSEAEIALALNQLASRLGAGSWPLPDGLWALEQTFVDVGTGRSIGSLPFFVRTLFALRAILDEGSPQPTILSIVPLGAGDRAQSRAACVRVEPTATVHPGAACELIVLGQNGVTTMPLGTGAETRDELENDRRRLRAMARQAEERHAALFTATLTKTRPAGSVETFDAALYQAFHFLELGAKVSERPHDTRRLRARDQAVYASPALSWPRGGAEEALDLGAGANAPFQNQDNAVAGRSGSFGAAAYSPPAAQQQSPYFMWSRRRAIFQSHARLGAPYAPTPRHLPPNAVRARAPTQSRIDGALPQPKPGPAADGGASFPPPHAPLLPGPFERATLGARPGVLIAESDAIVSTKPESVNFDPDHSRFGAPADVNTIIGRQLRWPRSSRLPETADLNFRRRTFVSLGDRGDGGELAVLRVLSGPSDLIRIDDARVSLKVTFVGGRNDLTDAERTSQEGRGDLRESIFLRISQTTNESHAVIKTLEQIGLTPGTKGLLRGGALETSRTLTGIVDLGAAALLRFDAIPPVQRVAMDPPHRSLAAIADAATADDPLTFTVGFAPQENEADEVIARGPRTELRFVGARMKAPAGLPVELATAMFGDPAHDQMLTTETEVAFTATEEHNYALACDRRAYRLDEVLHFAFGELEGEAFRPGLKGAISLRVIDAPDGTSRSQEVFIRPTGDNGKVRSGAVFAISLRDLFLAAPDGVERERFALAPRMRLQILLKIEEPPLDLSLSVAIVEQSETPPAPGVYAVITRETVARCAVKAFASAPTPQRFEFPNLLGDLARGAVRRRGLFSWRFAIDEVADEKAYAALIKIDQAGGGQMIDALRDFVALEQ